MDIIALIPAHNEEKDIGKCLESLLNQTRPPNRIVVILDRCSDGTKRIAQDYGVDTFETVDNDHKKAGALNQALHLVEGYNFIFDGDADTVFDPRLLENALALMEGDPSIGAVSCREGIKTYQGLSLKERFLYALVRNQRYRWDTDRLESRKGDTQIVVGPAGLFRTEAVMAVGGWQNASLTEDAAISYDLRLAGWRTVLGKRCYAYSDSPLGFKELWRQRVRWSRGYQDIKSRPWCKAMLGAKFQLLLERLYLLWLILWTGALLTGHVQWNSIWLVPMVLTVVDRLSRLRFFPKKTFADILLAILLPLDMIIFAFWQATLVTAWVQGSVIKSERRW